MSEKREAGLNKLDMQAVIAAWIVANDGCGGDNPVDCYGYEGIFKGAACPLYRLIGCIAHGDADVAGMAKAWLEEYCQRKVEAAEAEKRKVEAAKKEEQETKKTCGNCQHTPESTAHKNVKPCEKKKTNVPASSPGCPDFEPRVGRNDEDAAISQLEKEESEMAWRDFNSMYRERARLMVDGSQRDVDLLEITAKCKRLAGQRNRLSNALIKATRRVKEVERENDFLAKKLVDFTAKWNDLGGVYAEKDGLIDRLRRENAELRSWYEQLKKESFHPSERKQTLPPPMYLYVMGVTAEEFLAMKGRCRQV